MSDMTGPRPRGRPAKSAPESPFQRVTRLRAELEAAQAELQAVSAKRATLVGQIVIAHAHDDAAFLHTLADLLRTKLNSKADLALVAEFLTDRPLP